jgi:hypothetical protein
MSLPAGIIFGNEPRPYVQTGSSSQQRREHNDTMLEFTMRRTEWNIARRNDIELRGIDAVRIQLGTARR